MDLLKDNKSLYDNNLILMYKGEVTFALVTSIIETLEERVAELEESKKVRKKFYGAATESIQNLYHHMEEVSSNYTNISTYDSKSGLLMVTARNKFFNIMTGNFIPNSEITNLESKLHNINSLDRPALNALYKEILQNQGFSDKGTAGLGFVELSRKTGQKLAYEFHKIDEEISYFSLQVKIMRVKE